MSTTTVSSLFIIKKYHFNGSFENELKEKLLARYISISIRFKVIFLFFNNRNQVSYFCNSVNSADLEAKDTHAQSYLYIISVDRVNFSKL